MLMLQPPEASRRFTDRLLEPRVIAQSCVALCSGLMDAVTGQVIIVDEGWSLVSPIAYLTGVGWPAAFPPPGGAER